MKKPEPGNGSGFFVYLAPHGIDGIVIVWLQLNQGVGPIRIVHG